MFSLLSSLHTVINITLYLQRVQHSLPSHNDLFGLFLHRQRSDQSSHLFSCLPFGQLTQSLLPRPHAGVDDLQEQLPRARIEDKDGSIDRLGGQVTLKCLYVGEREWSEERGCEVRRGMRGGGVE